MSKLFIDSNKLTKLSMVLSKRIYEDNSTKPDAILGVSRGGCTPSIIVHEFLSYMKVKCIYGVISAKSYDDENNKLDTIEIDISNTLLDKLKNCSNIIIIDDVLDTGYTFMDIGNYLSNRGILSNTFNFASIYYKPTKNKTTIIPKYFVEETDKWIVFPHEFMGLNISEIENKLNDML